MDESILGNRLVMEADSARETAGVILCRMIENKRQHLAGMEHLLKIVEKVETGSPLEAFIWELLTHRTVKW